MSNQNPKKQYQKRKHIIIFNVGKLNPIALMNSLNKNLEISSKECSQERKNNEQKISPKLGERHFKSRKLTRHTTMRHALAARTVVHLL